MKEALYNLLPEVYREKDFSHGQSLRALMAVLEDAMNDVSDDIARMYRNWFIESCDLERVPFIADLVGVDTLDKGTVLPYERRYIANYLAYKRRNGMVRTLSNVVYDSSGFSCHVVDRHKQLATSWSAQNPALMPQTFRCMGSNAAMAGTAFDVSARTASFRSQKEGFLPATHGTVGSKTLACYLWPYQAVAVELAELTPSADHKQAYYISPFAENLALCHMPESLPNADRSPQPRDYPLPLTCANYYALNPNGAVTFYDGDQVIDPESIVIANLEHWKSRCKREARIVLDPERGRVWLREAELGKTLRVSYTYPMIAGFGAHPVYRLPVLQEDMRVTEPKQLVQLTAQSLTENRIVTLATNSVISRSSPLVIDLNGYDLTVRADQYYRPVIRGQIKIHNSAATPARVYMEGLVIEGGIAIADHLQLTVNHCTLTHASGKAIQMVNSKDTSASTHIALQNSILRTSILPANAHIEVSDSAVVLTGEQIRAYSLRALRSTMIGSLHCMVASEIKDCLIAGRLTIADTSRSHLSYSYIETLCTDTNLKATDVLTAKSIGCSVHFCSLQVGDADFALPTRNASKRLLTGASNGEEAGVFNQFQRQLKEHKIRRRMAEFAPVGLRLYTTYMD
jgi:hypothetical protein